MFSSTLFVGSFSAYKYAPLAGQEIRSLSFSWDSVIVLLVFFTIFMILALRFKKLSALSFKFLLLLVVFSGSEIIIGSVVSSPWDFLLALFVVVIFLKIHNVLVHDIGIMLGIAGVSSTLGITISSEIGIILLVVLSFYDILAVYWTKHMVYLARGMMESGAIFGFIIPFDFKDFFYHKTDAKQNVGDKFMILGSGDVGLPLILVSSVASISIQRGGIESSFVLSGLLLTHLIFINQRARRPMAALPPIATLTIIGYLVSLL